jgi:hypothetical protein
MTVTSTSPRRSRRSRVKREMQQLVERIRAIRREAPDHEFGEQVNVAIAETTSKLLTFGKSRTAHAFVTVADARTWDVDRHLNRGPQGAD